MGLISKNTRWIFILPSAKSVKTEERHIQDIAFGIKCLLKKGIDFSNIDIFIDNNIQTVTEYCFTLFAVPIPEIIYETSQLESVLKNNKKHNAVVFVTGHGSPQGMFYDIPIKPYSFYDIFQTAPNLKRTIFYFGQCYAGIFNYMPLSNHLNHSEKLKNNMVAVGATGLFTSYSHLTRLSEKIAWTGNLFLVNVFKWILQQDDVDGDSKYSVMDSFKYASIKTNEAILEMKKENTLLSMIGIEELLDKIKKQESSLASEIEMETIDNKLSIMNAVQEPWILNAQVAMNTEF